MAWINNDDNRRFITQVGFVCVTLGLLAFLQSINQEGDYKELIVGIIGIFIGVSSTAAKDLITGQSVSEIKVLRERLNRLEVKLGESEMEKAIYKKMVAELHDKLVQQSGILNTIKEQQ